MSIDPTHIATAFYAAAEAAWNTADGAGFGALFGDDTEFVDIRGVRHNGGPAFIGEQHQGIFDTIYKGSVIRYELERAREIAPGVVVANGRGTLDSPSGPLAGVRHAVSTVVFTELGGRWLAVAFHNTLVME